jgi:serine/threonine-protein kinase
VYEVGQIDGQHFYSMRFVEGESLAEILCQGPVPNRRAANYLEQVARALHALHLRGIVHRDLKPRNILVDANGRSFVTDFGLAKWSEYTQELTYVGACMGTPEYMAPEQACNPDGRGEVLGGKRQAHFDRLASPVCTREWRVTHQ